MLGLTCVRTFAVCGPSMFSRVYLINIASDRSCTHRFKICLNWKHNNILILETQQCINIGNWLSMLFVDVAVIVETVNISGSTKEIQYLAKPWQSALYNYRHNLSGSTKEIQYLAKPWQSALYNYWRSLSERERKYNYTIWRYNTRTHYGGGNKNKSESQGGRNQNQESSIGNTEYYAKFSIVPCESSA
jgi:hypothetical protein